MKTAIFVDSLVNKGGAERLVLAQSLITNADIYVGRYHKSKTFEEFKNVKIKPITRFYRYGYNGLLGKLLTLYLWFKFSRINLKGYNLFIFHGSGSLNSAKNNKPNIWYCHSPSRYLYDLYEEELERHKGISKLFFKFITGIQRAADQKNVSYVDKILVNSKNVQGRVKKYYDRESKVVYPFVDTSKFKFIEYGDFYLSTSRLDKIKRVDLIIKAFLKLPDKKLVVVSDGPEKEKLKAMAKDSKNITFLGYVSEDKLNELYGKCIATLHVSHKEDFGIVPIESMACGKPCIATNEGGFKETILHKKTGYLIDEPEDEKQMISAIKWLGKKRAIGMRKACQKRAELFSFEKFKKEILKEVTS